MNAHVMLAGILSRLAEAARSESGKVHSQSALVAGAILSASLLGTLLGANNSDADHTYQCGTVTCRIGRACCSGFGVYWCCAAGLVCGTATAGACD